MEEKKFVYEIECLDGTIYIGSTSNVERRMQEHKNGTGSAFTKKHGFKRLVESKAMTRKTDEDSLVIERMSEYGIDKVRGGQFCSEVLSKNQREYVTKAIQSIDNLCYVCSTAGHFANSCPKQGKQKCFSCGGTGHRSYECSKNMGWIEWLTSFIATKPDKPRTIVCYRCGLVGHFSSQCGR